MIKCRLLSKCIAVTQVFFRCDDVKLFPVIVDPNQIFNLLTTLWGTSQTMK